MSYEIQISGPVNITQTRASIDQLVEQRAAIVTCMSQLMRKDHDYGVIPGTGKPSLLKPGSEKILALFRLSAEPRVEDLSTPDTIRYRVTVVVSHTPSGTVIGYGLGEASSAEAKYQWREAVCNEEWEQTPPDRRRIKWKKGYQGRPAYGVMQVRTDMDDVANTILKMAKKRAQIDGVLTSTAASDVFAQDLDDLVAAGLDIAPETPVADAMPERLEKRADAPASSVAPSPAPTQSHAPAPAPAPVEHTSDPSISPQQTFGAPPRTISPPQASRFWAIAMQSGKKHTDVMAYLRNVLGVQKKEDIPESRYEEAIAWAQGGGR